MKDSLGGSSAPPDSRSRTVAVITAFGPGDSLAAVVTSALGQCARVIVVDNSPLDVRSAREVIGERQGVTIIANQANLGLAAALNIGVSASGKSDFIFFLDQDSVLAPSTVPALTAHLDSDERRAIAAPAPWDAEAGRYIDPRASGRPELAELPVVITSAMLLRRAAWAETNGMREDFFVDCVDQDLCLQLRHAGWTIVQDRSILLPHSLGATTWHGFGPFRLRATHHPQWRLYWVSRNGVMLSREYFRFDSRWAITNLMILAYWMVTVLLFEPPRVRGVRIMFHGMLDAFQRRRDRAFLPGSSR